MWNVILVLFAEFKLWMLVFDSSQKLRLTLEEEKIVLLSGGNAIIRFTRNKLKNNIKYFYHVIWGIFKHKNLTYLETFSNSDFDL